MVKRVKETLQKYLLTNRDVLEDKQIEDLKAQIKYIDSMIDKGKIVHSQDDGYEYISPSGIKYSLYEGKTIKGTTTSDICFIMNHNLEYDDTENMFVNWIYGVSLLEDRDEDAINLIYKYVSDYEEDHPEIVRKICDSEKDNDVIQYSIDVLDTEDDMEETIVKILENAGIYVMGTNFEARWTGEGYRTGQKPYC